MEVFDGLSTVDSEIVVVWTQCLIATPLNVEGDKVEAEGIPSAEQESRQL